MSSATLIFFQLHCDMMLPNEIKHIAAELDSYVVIYSQGIGV